MKMPLPHLKTAMTPFPYSIDVDATLAMARHMMTEHAFHHLPVTAGATIVGMLSSNTLERAVTANDATTTTVRDHYDSNAHIVSNDEPLHRVLAEMSKRVVDATIVTRHGRLAGVFTTVDACRALCDLLLALAPEPEDDAAA